MKNQEETPAALGFRVPAEWEPREATWIAWPTNLSDWPGKFGPIPWIYVEIVRLLSKVEPVKIVVANGTIEEAAREKLERGGANLGRVEFVRARTDRSWLRDSGPIFVVNDRAGTVACLDWKFNAWAKYDDHKQDEKLARRLAKKMGMKTIAPNAEIDGETRRLVLEGGAIDVNGAGTVLVTEECLLSNVQSRNPGLGREGIERVRRLSRVSQRRLARSRHRRRRYSRPC